MGRYSSHSDGVERGTARRPVRGGLTVGRKYGSGSAVQMDKNAGRRKRVSVCCGSPVTGHPKYVCGNCRQPCKATTIRVP